MTDFPVVEKGEFRDGRKKFRYLVDGELTRSVTEIIEWTFGKDKFGVGAWWGQEQGVRGTARLQQQGFDVPWDEPLAIIQMLKANKLTTHHVRDDAAARGTAIHDAAERWAKEGKVPNPADFPEEHRGYVRSLALWLTDYQPEFIDTEVTVGSTEHRYAGTYDLRCKIGDRIGLGDYKTSKHLYESVFFQLEGYEVASIECGYNPTDFRFAVRLAPDGEYEYEESRITAEMWLAQVEAYHAQVEAAEMRKLARAA